MPKALSLTQPFATLIALGYKKIETRGGRVNYTGPLLIHASATRNSWAKAACEQPVIKEILAKHGLTYDTLPRGVILCSCELLPVARMVLEPSPPPKKKPKKPRPELVIAQVSSLEQALGGWAPGRFAWPLADVQLLQQPVRAKGSLGMWDATNALQVFAAENGLRARLASSGPLFEPAPLTPIL
jgi:hypothetical protein